MTTGTHLSDWLKKTRTGGAASPLPPNLTLGDVSLTDDLAQETFIKAYLSLRSYQGLARFKTWLYRIAYNEYYTYLRKTREFRLDDNMTDKRDISPHLGDDARMDLEQCIAALNENERSVVLLFYMEDRPIKEIAQITGMPAGTVKSHIARGSGSSRKSMVHA